jgi:stage III sporulation protein AB
MIRLLGAALVAGAAVWIGFRAERSLRQHSAALRELDVGLELLRQEMELNAPPLPGLMEQLGKRTEGAARTLFSRCRDGLNVLEQESFPALWRRVVDSLENLGEDGKSCLFPLGQILGRCEGAEQCRAVACAQKRLKELAARAETETRRQGTVYRALGLSGGLFLVILLI